MKQRTSNSSSSSWRVPLLVLALTVVVSTWSLQQIYATQRSLAARRAGPALPAGHAANTRQQQEDMQGTLDALDMLNRLVPPPAQLTDAVCHTMPKAEYDGSVITWGSDHFKATSWDCCRACSLNPECNIWVWCGTPGGCGNGRKVHECWLKKAEMPALLELVKRTDWASLWTSGATYNNAIRQKLEVKGQTRLKRLSDDLTLPLVFLDVAIKDVAIGRITIVLFMKEAPRAAENFRRLCTGERGTVAAGKLGAGQPLHFKGAMFYRIIDRFIDQAGINTESALGGQFKDDAQGLELKHDRKGLLSMANGGPNTNTAHFSILMAPATHLDGHYTIFGEVVEGAQVLDKINALALGQPNNQAGRDAGVKIIDSGQLRRGTTTYSAG